MSESALTDRQLKAIPFIVTSPTYTAGLKKAELNRTTFYKWLKQPRFKTDRKARAGNVDFLLPRDSRGLVLDFHSFRHGYITAICKANVSPRVMMELARHSDPRLTMRRYSRVAVAESATALEALPKLGRPGVEAQGAALAKTGTDDPTAAQDAPGCPRTNDPAQGGAMEHPHRVAAKPFAKSGELSRTSANLGERKTESAGGENTLANIEETQCLRGVSKTRPTGFEPATSGSTVRYSNQLSYGPVACWRAVRCNSRHAHQTSAIYYTLATDCQRCFTGRGKKRKLGSLNASSGRLAPGDACPPRRAGESVQPSLRVLFRRLFGLFPLAYGHLGLLLGFLIGERYLVGFVEQSNF